MNKTVTTNTFPVFEWIKWLLAVLLFISGLVVNYYFVNIPFALRIAGWIVLLLIVLAVLLQTSAGKKLWVFFKEARGEMRKVVWPTRDVTIKTTMLILGIVFIFAIVMWGIDTFLMWLVNLVY